MKIQLITAVAALWSCHVAWAAEPADPDIALKPAHIIVNPWRFHIPPTKRQGVPGIERTAKGRLWAGFVPEWTAAEPRQHIASGASPRSAYCF